MSKHALLALALLLAACGRATVTLGNECTGTPIGEGSSFPALFRAAWLRNGGMAKLGCPTGRVRPWGGLEVQDLARGEARAMLVLDPRAEQLSAFALFDGLAEAWQERDGPEGPLGAARSDAHALPGRSVVWGEFARGDLYLLAEQSLAVLEPIRARHRAAGGAAGECGLPRAAFAEVVSPVGMMGTEQAFEGCRIASRRAEPPLLIPGPVDALAVHFGGVEGLLGFPDAEAEPLEAGFAQPFEGGCALWNARLGQHGVVPRCP